MKKFLKVLSVVVVAMIVALALGIQAVRTLRAIAAPEPLPYGLTMRDTTASVEQRLGQPRVSYAPQAG